MRGLHQLQQDRQLAEEHQQYPVLHLQYGRVDLVMP